MEERTLSTLKEMLIARGVRDEKFEVVGAPLDETKMFTFGGILIIFSMKARVSATDLTNFNGYASDNNHNNGIIIVARSRASDAVLDALRVYIADKDNHLVQFFEERHLQFNISKHVKVPKHRVILHDELDAVLKESNVKTPTLFSKIDSQDPMARWIGARPGDVVEITGMCESSVENKRYRFCMADVTNG